MVPCMQEVEKLFCAVLLSVRSGADPGLTDLQALPGVHTVFRQLTLCSDCFYGVLEGQKGYVVYYGEYRAERLTFFTLS